jgi:hypothetical protein
MPDAFDNPLSHAEWVAQEKKKYLYNMNYVIDPFVGKMKNKSLFDSITKDNTTESIQVKDKKEEAIINIRELANYYAEQECISTIKNFNLGIHLEEYKKAYKKHYKIILKFKNNEA